MCGLNQVITIGGIAGGMLLSATGLSWAAITPAVYDSSNWRNASATVNNHEDDGRGDTGTGAGTTVNGSYITYDLGSATTFSDVSATTWAGGFGAGVAGNFQIQVSTSDNPLNNDWVTIGTASNLFPNNPNISGEQNIGQRFYFPEQTKRYFRYVNDNPSGPYSLWLTELQLQRPVVVLSAANNTNNNFPINNSTDGDINSFANNSGESGNYVLDVLQQAGQDISGLTIAARQAAFWNGPKDVQVFYSPTDDVNNLTTLLASATLPETAATQTITFSSPVDARYFKLVWANTNEPGQGVTQIAEIGATYSAVPEPASLGLFAGAALMLIRRRKRN
ncbi:MAG: discoidin domain-containing protein [Phycisphaerales bacterium]|jgi:hypothetical protein|nr:discoidin domain-containing protein [Phycisphaerales bacterium]